MSKNREKSQKRLRNKSNRFWGKPGW